MTLLNFKESDNVWMRIGSASTWLSPFFGGKSDEDIEWDRDELVVDHNYVQTINFDTPYADKK